MLAGDRAVRGALTIEAFCRAPWRSISRSRGFPASRYACGTAVSSSPSCAVHRARADGEHVETPRTTISGVAKSAPSLIMSVLPRRRRRRGSARILRASVTRLWARRFAAEHFGSSSGAVAARRVSAAPRRTEVLVRSEEPLVFSDVTVRWGEATLLESSDDERSARGHVLPRRYRGPFRESGGREP